MIDVSTPPPAISNHETPVRLNIPVKYNYARVDGVFIDTIALHASICVKNIILLMLECTTRIQNIIQLIYAAEYVSVA